MLDNSVGQDENLKGFCLLRGVQVAGSAVGYHIRRLIIVIVHLMVVVGGSSLSASASPWICDHQEERYLGLSIVEEGLNFSEVEVAAKRFGDTQSVNGEGLLCKVFKRFEAQIDRNSIPTRCPLIEEEMRAVIEDYCIRYGVPYSGTGDGGTVVGICADRTHHPILRLNVNYFLKACID